MIDRNKSIDGIILIITSFNQLYNFLSYFDEKDLIKKKYIYLTVFSDHIPDSLIFHFKEYLSKFTNVEIIDMRRKSHKIFRYFANNKITKIFSYYTFVLKKIFLIKKNYKIKYISVHGKIQYPMLLLMIFIKNPLIFLMEDGIGEYVPYSKNEKKPIIISLLKKILIKNKLRVRILQLAKSRNDYSRILDQPFLKKEYFLDNRNTYKNFIKKNFQKKLLFNPRCIVIGKPIHENNIEYFTSLYLRILNKVHKKYSYKTEEILFFPHPRQETFYLKKLEKNLSDQCIIHPISPVIAEHYFSEESLKIVIGTLSSALYYAKTIFHIPYVYYQPDETKFKIDNEREQNFLKIFESVGLESFFN